jgi:hypothetical protein
LSMPLVSVYACEAAGGECCANAVRKVEEAPHSMSFVAVINSQHRQVDCAAAGTMDDTSKKMARPPDALARELIETVLGVVCARDHRHPGPPARASRGRPGEDRD